MEARIAVLDGELEGAALVSEHESICWNYFSPQQEMEELDILVKKRQEQDDGIKQLREELASNQKLLADNQKKDDEVIASGKAEVEA